MIPPAVRLLLAVLSLALAGVSCAPTPMYREVRRQGPNGAWYIERTRINPADLLPRFSAPRDDSWWNGDHLSGKPSMTINLSEQRIYYYKGGQLAGVSTISSGREGFSTPTGSFKIIQKSRDHKSSLYGDYVDAHGQPVQKDVDVRKDPKPPGARFDGADMRYFMRVTGAVGMHEGYLPGFPASHGCIRLPGRMARIFFAETPLGTPVKVVGRAPEPSPYLARAPAPAAPPPPSVLSPMSMLRSIIPERQTPATRPVQGARQARGGTRYLE